jgi:2-polyprenyl-3-methyl-5-hydroxy-6-metoxy-1,4-benzoquinol methylase
VEPAQGRYDSVVEEYVAMFGDAVDDPATAAVLSLLGPVTATEVLDVPCGDGRVARELARRGAQVLGADLSAEMLKRALRLEEATPLSITYMKVDATSPDAFMGQTFDTVVCNYGLSDIDDLDGFLDVVTRVLRPGCFFVFSILHPCFPGWGSDVPGSWPPGGGYFHEGWWQVQGHDLRRVVGSNHRMLSTYLNALAGRGLVLEQLVEPPPPSMRLNTEPVPMFLAVRCRKG